MILKDLMIIMDVLEKKDEGFDNRCMRIYRVPYMQKLIKNDYEVLGIDNFNSYYDISLKESRLIELNNILREDIKNFEVLKQTFYEFKPDIVVNLVAQAGVRYSIENPSEYIQSNLLGFGNILECCRMLSVKNFV